MEHGGKNVLSPPIVGHTAAPAAFRANALDGGSSVTGEVLLAGDDADPVQGHDEPRGVLLKRQQPR